MEDLVELIGQDIELKEKGSSYVGICPFHDDNRPSLHVNNEKQIWKCFVCEATGKTYEQFKNKLDNLNNTGPITPGASKKVLKWDILTDNLTQDVYKTDQETYNFIIKNNLHLIPASKYDVYFSSFKSKLYKGMFLFTFNPFNDNQLENIQQRVMNSNLSYRYVSLGKKVPWGFKFLNYDLDKVVIVEGIKDAIALKESGEENVIAINALSLNDIYINTLKGRFKNIYISLDNDDAGKNKEKEYIKKYNFVKYFHSDLDFYEGKDYYDKWVKKENQNFRR